MRLSEDSIRELRDEIKEINEKVTRLLTKEEDREVRCKDHQKIISELVDFKTRYETIRTAILTLILTVAAIMAILWNYTNYTNYRPPSTRAAEQTR